MGGWRNILFPVLMPAKIWGRGGVKKKKKGKGKGRGGIVEMNNGNTLKG